MPKVEWHGARLIAAAQQAALETARMTAEIVKGKAVNLAPLNMDTPAGTLRNSATVTEIDKGAEISFNTPYAVVMHESMSYTPSHAGTGPNYLRQPMLDEEEAYYRAVEEAMKAIFG